MDFQDRLASLGVRRIHRHVAVEAAGAQKRGVQDIRTVGRGDHDDAGVLIEAVHLHQQLVQCLFALVVTAAHAGAALASDGVDLVDKDQRRAIGLGGVKKIANAAGADANEHLNEVRARNVEERNARLAGDGAGQHRLTASRRSQQQDALRDLGAQGLELLRVLQELDDFLQFLFGFLDSGHIVKSDLRNGCPSGAWPWSVRTTSPGYPRSAPGAGRTPR